MEEVEGDHCLGFLLGGMGVCSEGWVLGMGGFRGL